jgi:hypothetical protein
VVRIRGRGGGAWAAGCVPCSGHALQGAWMKSLAMPPLHSCIRSAPSHRHMACGCVAECRRLCWALTRLRGSKPKSPDSLQEKGGGGCGSGGRQIPVSPWRPATLRM